MKTISHKCKTSSQPSVRWRWTPSHSTVSPMGCRRRWRRRRLRGQHKAQPKGACHNSTKLFNNTIEPSGAPPMMMVAGYGYGGWMLELEMELMWLNVQPVEHHPGESRLGEFTWLGEKKGKMILLLDADGEKWIGGDFWPHDVCALMVVLVAFVMACGFCGLFETGWFHLCQAISIAYWQSLLTLSLKLVNSIGY